MAQDMACLFLTSFWTADVTMPPLGTVHIVVRSTLCLVGSYFIPVPVERETLTRASDSGLP